VYDVLRHQRLLLTRAAVAAIAARLEEKPREGAAS
jgi:ribosomal protein L4